MKKLLLSIWLIAAVAAFAIIPGNAPVFRSALTNTAVVVSAAPCYLAGYNAANTNNSTVYLQFFDAAAAGNVTLGTTTPTMVLAIPANGVIDGLQSAPPPFQNGIVMAATTTATGSTAPSTPIPVTVILK